MRFIGSFQYQSSVYWIVVGGVPIVSGMISQDCGFDDLPAFRRDIDVVDPIPVRPSFPTTESTSQFHPGVQLAKGIAKSSVDFVHACGDAKGAK